VAIFHARIGLLKGILIPSNPLLLIFLDPQDARLIGTRIGCRFQLGRIAEVHGTHCQPRPTHRPWHLLSKKLLPSTKLQPRILKRRVCCAGRSPIRGPSSSALPQPQQEREEQSRRVKIRIPKDPHPHPRVRFLCPFKRRTVFYEG
jgi:hypothetical protein